MISELKAFLLRGDVITLAVAVIIAGAFQKIVDSLVKDIITPVIGMAIGNPDFSKFVIGGKEVIVNGVTQIEGGIMIGNFINAVISFLLLGTVLFFLIKAAGKKTEEIK